MTIKTKKVGITKQREIVSVHLPKGYKAKLGKLAFDQDRSVSALIKRQIDRLLKEEGQNV
jgi:hypothetical protein